MKPRASLNIGIEEEYQIIDPETRELRSYIQQFLDKGQAILPDQLRAEFMQSQLEAGTAVCANVKEAREELARVRGLVRGLAEREGLWVGAAGTHPFSSWTSQTVSPYGRYPELARFLQDVGRRLLVFGTHVHIGVEDEELLIEVMNGIRQFLPELLALSSSSPLWHGRDTGLKSYRSVVFDSLPRTGIPPHFDSHAEYRQYVDLLLETGSISEPTHIWWDVRPSEKFPTLEVRIPDMCTRLDETICLVALVQAIVARLVGLSEQDERPHIYRRHLMNENKWRSMRYGIGGKLIDFDGSREVSVGDRVERLLEWLDDTLDDLDCREEAEYATKILSEGASADRQLEAFRRSGDMISVVDLLVEEAQQGLD